MIAEVEIEILLRMKFRKQRTAAADSARNYIPVVGGQEAGPNGVGYGERSECGGDRRHPASVLGAGERQRGGDAVFRQLVDVIRTLHRHLSLSISLSIFLESVPDIFAQLLSEATIAHIYIYTCGDRGGDFQNLF